VGYQAPPPVETYRLDALADAQIPPETRAQFTTDDHGRLIWFAVPPRNDPPRFAAPPHAARYLAWRARADEERARERAAREEREGEERVRERRKGGVEEGERRREVEELKVRAIRELEERMADNLVEGYRRMYGEGWKEKAEEELKRWKGKMEDHAKLAGEIERQNEDVEDRMVVERLVGGL